MSLTATMDIILPNLGCSNSSKAEFLSWKWWQALWPRVAQYWWQDWYSGPISRSTDLSRVSLTRN